MIGSSTDLNYAYFDGSVWTITTVDSGIAGYNSSIAIDSANRPHIVYWDDLFYGLKYAYYNGSTWAVSSLSIAGSPNVTSIDTDSSNHPHISYYASGTADLKYTSYSESSWSTPTTIDSTGSVGDYNSLKLDSSDNAKISYYDATNGDLKYASFDGSSWTTSTIDSAGDVGKYTSIVLNTNNNPEISYYDVTNGNLKYAYYYNSQWSTSIIDSSGDVGKYTSIAQKNNNSPKISYYDITNGNLKYASIIPSTYPRVIKDSSTYKMWVGYSNESGNNVIAYATSEDGTTWSEYQAITDLNGAYEATFLKDSTDGKIKVWYDRDTQLRYKSSSDGGATWSSESTLTGFTANAWEASAKAEPYVLKDGTNYKMYYDCISGSDWDKRICYATSTDGIDWDNDAHLGQVSYGGNTDNNIVLSVSGSGWDSGQIYSHTVLKNTSNTFEMWYAANNGDSPTINKIGYATSADGTTFNSNKSASNPVLTNSILYPNVIEDGSAYKMWYADDGWAGKLYLATAPVAEGVDGTAPILTQVTAVTTPTSDTTPNYIFNSDEAGTISYDGDCTSGTTSAIAGDNTITFSALSAGTHSNCKVRVTDASSNPSSWLTVNSFTIDTTAPTISNINSDKANGSYKIGEVIDIDVNFSEAVTSTGNVTVTLETGDTDRTCTFTVSNASSGTCNYTVQTGDTTSQLNANTVSGTIADQASNAMVSFTIPFNIASYKALVIDTTSPVTASQASLFPGYYNSSNWLGTFDGAVADNSGGAGLDANSTKYYIKQNSTGKYFTPNGLSDSWEDGLYWLPATNDATSLGASTSWSTSEIPTAEQGHGNSITDGIYEVRAKAVDKAGNEYQGSAVTFTFDHTAPTSTSVSINSGDAYTTSTASTLTLSATDATSGNYQMRFSNDNSTWSDWEAYSTSKSWTLSSSDGTKTVYAQFKDNAGNISTSTSDTIIYDHIAPASTSISINSAATYTNSTSTTLTLSATDATSGNYQMRFSNDNSTWSSWETYATSKTGWTLTSSDGTKTVYAEFKDNAGNVSDAVNDTIIYDGTNPTTPASIYDGANIGVDLDYTSLTDQLSANWTASTDTGGSGIQKYQYAIGTTAGGTNIVDWTNNGTNLSVTKTDLALSNDISYYFTVRSVDNAGNNSTAINSDGITVDTSTPIATVTTSGYYNASGWSIAGSQITGTYTNADEVKIKIQKTGNYWDGDSWESSDPGWLTATLASGIWHYDLAGANLTDGVTYSISTKAKDTGRDREEVSGTGSFTYDATAPISNSISINSAATYTNSTSATLTLSSTDATSGNYQMRFSNDNSTWSSWETYATSKTGWTLTSSDGTKTVYAEFKDNAGNVSDAVSDTIIYDGTAPASTSISINSGDTYTKTTSSTLTLSATDALSGNYQMRFSNDNSTWSDWETYATSKTGWTLTSSDGTKTVYTQFKGVCRQTRFPINLIENSQKFVRYH